MGHVLTKETTAPTNMSDSSGFEQTSENYMSTYYEWEKEYLSELADKMQGQSKRDFWRNSKKDHSSMIYESGMDYIKDAREAALAEADKIREQSVIRAGMEGLQDIRPHLYEASQTGGATLSELKDLDSILGTTRPKKDDTWERWLHGAASSYNQLTEAEKSTYKSNGFTKEKASGEIVLDRSRIIEDIAGKEFLLSKQRSLAPEVNVTNTQKAENAYSVGIGKISADAVGKRINRVLHSGSLVETEGLLADVNQALKIVGSGQFKTGPTAPARLWLQRFIDDTFGKGLRMNPDGDPDLVATKDQRQLIRSMKEGLLGKYGAITNVALGEQLKMIGENLGLGYLSKTKGAISDKEMSLFMNIGFNISKSPEGNIRILNILKRTYEKALAERTVTIQLYKDLDTGKLKRNGEVVRTVAELGNIGYTLYMAEHFASKWGYDPETGIGSIITPDDVAAALAMENVEVAGAGTDGIELPTLAGWKIGSEVANSIDTPDAVALSLKELPEPTCTATGFCIIVRKGEDGVKRVYQVHQEQ